MSFPLKVKSVFRAFHDALIDETQFYSVLNQTHSASTTSANPVSALCEKLQNDVAKLSLLVNKASAENADSVISLQTLLERTLVGLCVEASAQANSAGQSRHVAQRSRVLTQQVVRAVADLALAVIERESVDAAVTGAVWEQCEKFKNFRFDAKQWPRQMLKDTLGLIADARQELQDMLEDAGNETDDDDNDNETVDNDDDDDDDFYSFLDGVSQRLSAAEQESAREILIVVKCSWLAVNQVKLALGSLSVEQLDQLLDDVQPLSKCVDDLVSRTYAPQERAALRELSDELRGAVQLIVSRLREPCKQTRSIQVILTLIDEKLSGG